MGAQPGTLAISADARRPVISYMHYNETEYTEPRPCDATKLRDLIRQDMVTWIDVEGLGDEGVIRSIGQAFSLHPLSIEDIVHEHQRPKTERYQEYGVFTTRFPVAAPSEPLRTEQVTLFLTRQYVLTFHEKPLPVLQPIRERIRNNALIRRHGSDYLAYAVVDAIIDAYYPLVESMGDMLEDLEDEAMTSTRQGTLRKISQIKRDLLTARRVLWRQREAISSVLRDDSELIDPPVRVFIRDSYDHCVQLLDILESYRETAGTLVEVHLSSLSNRTNEVMKVLTIMSTIFIPLTFLSSIYGMNFEHMPELRARWGYPALLLVMFSIASAMVFIFYRRGWINWLRPAEIEESKPPELPPPADHTNA